uniref:X-linked retinitis pigmentosa GTPase regulator-interacting protein 1-like n=1 Tax=Dromaius novaehollandiae TaxID=8790 RepID=A0A8C4J0Y5_DRONO
MAPSLRLWPCARTEAERLQGFRVKPSRTHSVCLFRAGNAAPEPWGARGASPVPAGADGAVGTAPQPRRGAASPGRAPPGTQQPAGAGEGPGGAEGTRGRAGAAKPGAAAAPARLPAAAAAPAVPPLRPPLAAAPREQKASPRRGQARSHPFPKGISLWACRNVADPRCRRRDAGAGSGGESGLQGSRRAPRCRGGQAPRGEAVSAPGSAPPGQRCCFARVQAPISTHETSPPSPLSVSHSTRGAGFAEQQPPRLQHGSEAEQQCQLRRYVRPAPAEMAVLGGRSRGTLMPAGSWRKAACFPLSAHCRAAIRSNVELIRLQRLLQERGVELAGARAHLGSLRQVRRKPRRVVGSCDPLLGGGGGDKNHVFSPNFAAARTPPPPPPPASVAWCEVTEQRPNRMVPGSTEREERQQVPGTPEPPHAPGPDEPLALRRKVRETEAAHAETVLELEKTRDMLILQHRINRDYQVELESVVLQAERERRSHEEERQHQAQLLELRAARIRQLEGQLREVAYGARWLPAPPAANAGADAGAAPAPCGGEVLLELHVAGAALSAEALGHLGDAQPLTFCTYGIYDFETHCTPLALGPRPRYGFTSQYVARDEPLFLRYLRRSAARLELHWAAAAEHGTLASCWLRFSEALGHGRRVPATAALRGTGESFGVLEYWTRLQLPRLRASRDRAAGVAPPAPLPQVLEAEGLRNELRVQVTGCAGLRARRLGAWPSPYAIYRFFAFPDHATLVVPGSGEPRFGDLRAFPLRVTAELHRYLRLGRLRVYVFDDEDDEEPGAYLGKAEVPLLPLARGRSVTGDFALADPHGNPNGTINLSLEWQHRYAPPAPRLPPPARLTPGARVSAGGRRYDLLRPARPRRPPAVSYLLKQATAAASLERESASEAPSTDSDEIVVGSSPWKPASERIRVEVVSLRLHAGTPAHGSAGCLRQLYVEYHFPGVPPAETEMPLALREPRGSEELFFHSSRVIRLDGEVGKARRELLFAMLRDKELGCSRLRFTVVSEPVAGAPGGECQELGTAWLDLAEILRTGRDALERDLDGEQAPPAVAPAQGTAVTKSSFPPPPFSPLPTGSLQPGRARCGDRPAPGQRGSGRRPPRRVPPGAASRVPGRPPSAVNT